MAEALTRPAEIYIDGGDSWLSRLLVREALTRDDIVLGGVVLSGEAKDPETHQPLTTPESFLHAVVHDSVYGRLPMLQSRQVARIPIGTVSPFPIPKHPAVISTDSCAEVFRERWWEMPHLASVAVTDRSKWAGNTYPTVPLLGIADSAYAQGYGWIYNPRSPLYVASPRLQAILPMLGAVHAMAKIERASVVEHRSYDANQALQDRAASGGLFLSTSATLGSIELPTDNWLAGISRPNGSFAFLWKRLRERSYSVPMADGARVDLDIRFKKGKPSMSLLLEVLESLGPTYAVEAGSTTASTQQLKGRSEVAIINRDSIEVGKRFASWSLAYDPAISLAHRTLDIARAIYVNRQRLSR